MRVRVRIRLWVVLTTDRETGKTFPLYTFTKCAEAHRVCVQHRDANSGYTFVVRPFRYDELAQVRRKTRRRRKAQEKSFQHAGDSLQ